MSWSYSCPHCRAALNPDATIILVGDHGGVSCLVGFHPKPGNYKAYLPPGIDVVPGTRWRFSCPVCGADLVTEVCNGLCALDMATGGVAHRVYFSPVAGEQATFVVSAEGFMERHGRDVSLHPLDLLDLA